jgi:alkyldihydroxyacetonephosphate synthase
VIDVKRMNRVLSFSEEDALVVAESGVLLRKLEEFLNEKGFTLRHIPQSYPEAALGGLIATMSTGQFSTKYGGIEELLVDLEAVAPDGGLIPMRRSIVPRAATGPDLKRLLVGSEGCAEGVPPALPHLEEGLRLPQLRGWAQGYEGDHACLGHTRCRQVVRQG